jgi:hypothetical protein
MTEQYPRHKIDDEIEVRTADQDLRGTITGISYVCPVYMYVVQLINPIEGEFGLQTGLYVPEGILLPKPEVDSLSQLARVGSYVYVDEDENSGDTIAIDVDILIATEDDVSWYVISNDVLDGKQPVIFTPFNDYNDALEFASNYIKENHAAAPDETAEQYLARVSLEGEDGVQD